MCAMTPNDLNTPAPITWCPGCGNFGILTASKMAIAELINEGFAQRKDFVITADIGCGAKIYDYINVNGFYGLHGRAIPPAVGIKLANPELKVIAYGGDGGLLNEGISHLLHAARYNSDITVVLHNNQVFALTTGQATATTEKGFKGKSTPLGTFEEPLNPIALTLEAGATFVAREFAYDVVHLKETLKAAIKHRGFSLVEVLQPCVSFHDTTQYFREHVYRLEEEGHDPKDFEAALRRAREWNYNLDPDARVPTGIFYVNEDKMPYEEGWPSVRKGPFWKRERNRDWKEIVSLYRVD